MYNVAPAKYLAPAIFHSTFQVHTPPVMDQDPYKLLGLDKNADPAEVKRAFRALAMRYHPDVTTEADAAKRFEEVCIAADAILNRVWHALMAFPCHEPHCRQCKPAAAWCFLLHVRSACSMLQEQEAPSRSIGMQARRPTAHAAGASAPDTSSISWRTERLTRPVSESALHHTHWHALRISQSTLWL